MLLHQSLVAYWERNWFSPFPTTELNTEISCSFIEEIQLALVHNRLLDDFTQPTLEISLPYATDFTLNGTYLVRQSAHCIRRPPEGMKWRYVSILLFFHEPLSKSI